MRTFDPSQMTRTVRQKIGKRASRNVGSEVTLILTAGFAALMIVLFWFVNLSFLPLAKMFGISPTLDWIGLAVTISFAFGIVHGWFASSVVAQARKQQFEIHQFDEANKRAETEEKIKVLKSAQKQ